MAYVCPHCNGHSKSHGCAQNQWGSEMYSAHNEVIAWASKEGKIGNKMPFTTTGKKAFYSFLVHMLTTHNFYSTLST